MWSEQDDGGNWFVIVKIRLDKYFQTGLTITKLMILWWNSKLNKWTIFLLHFNTTVFMHQLNLTMYLKYTKCSVASLNITHVAILVNLWDAHSHSPAHTEGFSRHEKTHGHGMGGNSTKRIWCILDNP